MVFLQPEMRRRSMPIQLSRRLFTVHEYHQMGQTGILSEDDRVELIEGEIVQMASIGSRHAACVDRLNQLFSSRVMGRAIVRVQNPIYLSEYSEPRPDLALLMPRRDFYAAAHPGPQDVLLVVEVADTSAGIDRAAKMPLYARAGIPEAWLVDLQEDRVELHSQPLPQGYQRVHHFGRGASLALQAFPDLTFAIDGILGIAAA
jgi:Uma2 family endonuclease